MIHHLDIPMKDFSLYLDDELIVDKGDVVQCSKKVQN